jgi:hypothetical protein
VLLSRSLVARVDKRGEELARLNRRAATQAGVRPSYMDEYVALEAELAGLHAVHLERWGPAY